MFLSTDIANDRNLVRYFLDNRTLETLHSDPSGISTHLAVDSDEECVYWIHYLFGNANDFTLYKTSYDNMTTQVLTGSRSNTNIDVTVGDGYYYLLDSTTSKIEQYSKDNDSLVGAFSIGGGTKRIFLVEGTSKDGP